MHNPMQTPLCLTLTPCFQAFILLYCSLRDFRLGALPQAVAVLKVGAAEVPRFQCSSN
jgi:hypothetical protein